MRRVTEEIELLEGKLKLLKDKIAYSTITVTFEPRGSTIQATRIKLPFPWLTQLGLPTLFCHSLEANAEGILVNYHLRMPDQKREAVKRFKELNFKVAAAGDSYNDTAMLGEAHGGILFHPPENVIREFPQYPVVRDYAGLRAEIDKVFARV